MTVAYWIIAGLLALLYLYSGGLKVLRSPDQLRPMTGWVDTVPLRLVRTIGVLEILGAIGLILPPLTGSRWPWPWRQRSGSRPPGCNRQLGTHAGSLAVWLATI